MVGAGTFISRYVFFIPIYLTPIFVPFAFAGFSFSFALVFSFSPFPLLNIVCIAAPRFGVRRKVSILTDEVVDERVEVSRE